LLQQVLLQQVLFQHLADARRTVSALPLPGPGKGNAEFGGDAAIFAASPG
jgi:hypothetical protein